MKNILKINEKEKTNENDSFIRVLIHFQKDFCKTP